LETRLKGLAEKLAGKIALITGGPRVSAFGGPLRGSLGEGAMYYKGAAAKRNSLARKDEIGTNVSASGDVRDWLFFFFALGCLFAKFQQ